jgi:fatty-acyl-CoA synthase
MESLSHAISTKRLVVIVMRATYTGHMISTDDVLTFWCAANPAGAAVRFAGQDVTWRELDRRVADAAGLLQADGVGAGTHVAILLENRPEFIVYVIAVHRLGGVVVPLNVRAAPPELPPLMQRSDTMHLVSSDRFRAHIDVITQQVAGVVVRELDRSGTQSAEPVPAHPKPADADPVAFICFTSGTTGMAKGAELTHDSYLAGALKIMLSDRLNADDKSLLALPLAFTGSLTCIWASIYLAGGTLVLEQGFDAEGTLAQLESERATVFYGVPFLYQQMSRTPGFGSADLSALRVGRAAAAPVPVSLLEEWSRKGVPLSQGYGLTEGGGTNIQLPLGMEKEKLGWAGIALLGGQLRVVDADGTDCAPGEVGELLLAGPELMRGYYGNEEATARALSGGWLHTGDLVETDGNGYIRIVDRKSDMIISGGLNVYPAEVEAAVTSCNGVVTAAVFGLPDDTWGEIVAAVVVVDGSVEWTAESIRQQCRSKIGDYKLPRRVVIQSTDLPRNMAGKVLKNELRKMLSS